MSRAYRHLGFVVAAALLAGCGGREAGVAPAPAAAEVPTIVGTLTYRLADGAAHELEGPVHGACVPLEGAAVSIDNGTDATAHLRDGCDGQEGDVVIPGAAWKDGNGPAATAVVMLRH